MKIRMINLKRLADEDFGFACCLHLQLVIMLLVTAPNSIRNYDVSFAPESIIVMLTVLCVSLVFALWFWAVYICPADSANQRSVGLLQPASEGVN